MVECVLDGLDPSNKTACDVLMMSMETATAAERMHCPPPHLHVLVPDDRAGGDSAGSSVPTANNPPQPLADEEKPGKKRSTSVSARHQPPECQEQMANDSVKLAGGWIYT